MQAIFDTSAIEQIHVFALFLKCWWMEARDIRVGKHYVFRGNIEAISGRQHSNKERLLKIDSL